MLNKSFLSHRRQLRGVRLEEDVRQSIARIEASPFLPHKDRVRGFVYDVRTGRLAEV
jgi:carbonic anhydrase